MNIADGGFTARTGDAISLGSRIEEKAREHEFELKSSGQKDDLAPEKRREEINKDEVEAALKDNEKIERFVKKGFNFNVHEATDRIWVEIVDQRENEVLKEIPPEKVLDMIAGIKEAAGLIIDEKA